MTFGMNWQARVSFTWALLTILSVALPFIFGVSDGLMLGIGLNLIIGPLPMVALLFWADL